MAVNKTRYCANCSVTLNLNEDLCPNCNTVANKKQTATSVSLTDLQKMQALIEELYARKSMQAQIEKNKEKELDEVISEFYPKTLRQFEGILEDYSCECYFSRASNGLLGQLKGASNMPNAEVTYDPNIGTYEIFLKSYDFKPIREVVAFIKTFIPGSNRSYDPQTKIWTIEESNWVAVKATLEHYKFYIEEKTKAQTKSFDPNEFFYDPTPAPITETKESIQRKLETILEVSVISLSEEELKKAYRKKALVLHPDRNNGDGSRMSELNSLWTVFNQK